MSYPLTPLCSSLLTGLLALLIPQASSAQEVTPPITLAARDFTSFLGFQAGYSYYTMVGTEADFFVNPSAVGYSSLPNGHQTPAQWFTCGLIVRRRLLGNLALQGELNYVRKGGQLKNEAFYERTLVAVNYVQVPVLLHLNVPIAGAFSLHAEGGAGLNLALNERKVETRYHAPSTTYVHNAVLLAPTVGAGAAWQQQRRSYYLTFRYSSDTRAFYQRQYNGTDFALRHRGATVTAAVLFGRQ